MVIARTTEGDLGVLPGHTPVLSLIIEGVVPFRFDASWEVAAPPDRVAEVLIRVPRAAAQPPAGADAEADVVVAH